MNSDELRKLGVKSDLTGKRFGRLLVIRPYDKRNRAWRWLCKCDCGNETVGIGAKMKQGFKRSCGCFRSENVKPKYGKNHRAWTGYEDLPGSKWIMIKTSAKKRNIPFNLTIQEAWNLYAQQSGKCALTGVPIAFGKENVPQRKHEGTASLDRIDSAKSYELGNVQWVHKDVNYMKAWFDQERFLEICKQVVEYKKL